MFPLPEENAEGPKFSFIQYGGSLVEPHIRLNLVLGSLGQLAIHADTVFAHMVSYCKNNNNSCCLE